MADLVGRGRDAYTRWNNPPSCGLPDDAGVVLEMADRIAALEAEASEGERRGLERGVAVASSWERLTPTERQSVRAQFGWTERDFEVAVNVAKGIADTIRALIPEAPARERWQPIETAPRDGSEIILHDRGTVGTGFYSEAPEARRAEAGWFWEDDRGNLVIAKNADPTHWMPLPPPPSQDREPDSQRGAK